MSTKTHPTIEDLYRVPDKGKAEIVNGEILTMSPTGGLPGRAGGAIYASLRGVERSAGGRAYPNTVGFKVNLPTRKSFSPDAAFYVGAPSGMKFLEGAPVCAVEIRSENDYGTAAELELQAKRKDYFAAGTLVVWDVDLLSEDIVRVYRATDPDNAKIFGHGDFAEAEPAVPGWKMAVNELFD